MVEDNYHNEEKITAEKLISVAGVLGGLAFTALVFVLQATSTFEKPSWGYLGAVYFTILTSAIAVVSILFILSCALAIPIVSGRRSPKNLLWKFQGDIYIVALLALLSILPILLIAVDWTAALIAGVMELLLAIIIYSLSGTNIFYTYEK